MCEFFINNLLHSRAGVWISVWNDAYVPERIDAWSREAMSVALSTIVTRITVEIAANARE